LTDVDIPRDIDTCRYHTCQEVSPVDDCCDESSCCQTGCC
jgi:hypothetical protein